MASMAIHHSRHHGGHGSLRLGCLPLGDPEDCKIHHSHSGVPPTLLQRVKDNLRVAGQLRAPLHICAALCFISMWVGSSLVSFSSVPTPNVGASGPAHSRALKFAGKESAHVGNAPAHQSSAAIITDADIGMFEAVALNRSGFSNVRPPVTPAESGESFLRAVPAQVISWYPRITYYPGFLSRQQADHVIALAKKFMTPSDLAYRPGESIPETQEVRTSTGCFLMPEQDKDGILAAIEDKIAAVTHLPVENGEAFNVLRYINGQHYDSHMDAFDPKEYGNQPSQRIATLLMYLRAPEEGGETVFKREGEFGYNRTIDDWRTCKDNLGVKVKPQTGDAVLFWSAHADLRLDPRALHGACPVVRGEKWSMAKWIREKPNFGSRRARRTPI